MLGSLPVLRATLEHICRTRQGAAACEFVGCKPSSTGDLAGGLDFFFASSGRACPGD